MSTSKTQVISNSVYDKLKFTAQYVLPGVGTLYFALAQIWGLPNGEEIVGTITAVDIFLGGFLGYTTKRYSNSNPPVDGN